MRQYLFSLLLTFQFCIVSIKCTYLSILKGVYKMVVQMVQDDALLTFKEAMSYLRVSRSTLYRLMWSGQLTGHKVGSTWRFYREDLRACVGREVMPMVPMQPAAN
jgi:excisionase family DNA binding protein